MEGYRSRGTASDSGIPCRVRDAGRRYWWWTGKPQRMKGLGEYVFFGLAVNGVGPKSAATMPWDKAFNISGLGGGQGTFPRLPHAELRR